MEPEPLIEVVPESPVPARRRPASPPRQRHRKLSDTRQLRPDQRAGDPAAGPADDPHLDRDEVAGTGAEPLAQLSLFGAEAAAPAPEDLEGLLAGPGQVVRMGGTARVSVVVGDAWRARALVREFALRGLPGTCVPTAEEHIGVRTAYSAALAPLAATWLRGAAVKLPPRDFLLEGRRLRLWTLAAGHLDGLGFTLRLGTADEAAWPVIGRALAVLGLPAVLLGPRAGGPAYRISGQRRLYRLAELVGDPPPEVPPEAWPARYPGAGRVHRDATHD